MSTVLLWKALLLKKAKLKCMKKKRNIEKRVTIINKASGSAICRVCGENNASISIFSSDNQQANIAMQIQNFSGVKILASDTFPKHICPKCLDLLNKCILFRDLCQETHKAFKSSGFNVNAYKHENNSDATLSRNQNNLDIIIKTEACGNISDDDSYNIPSPSFSEDPEWNYSKDMNGSNNLDYNKERPKIKKENPQEEESQPKEKKKFRKKKLNFLCDTCGKALHSPRSLVEHVNTHNNVFPYKCDDCPYQGRTVSLLRVHQRSHLADKPCKCTQCPFATTTASNLASHVRRAHSNERPFKCTACGKAFKANYQLKQHYDRFHLNLHTMECEICFKTITKKKMSNHLWRIHKLKPEKSGLPNRLPSYILATRKTEASSINQNNLIESNQL